MMPPAKRSRIEMASNVLENIDEETRILHQEKKAAKV